MIADYMVKGMAVGAWVIGFLVVTGGFAAVCWLFCAVMAWAFGNDGEENEEQDDRAEDRDAGRDEPGLSAEDPARRARFGADDL